MPRVAAHPPAGRPLGEDPATNDPSPGAGRPQYFRYEFPVDAPVERVASFHFDPGALKELTPPLAGMRPLEAEPLAEGSVVRFTLGFGPARIPWTARHEDVGPRGFTDVQIEGPLASWRHRHEFRPLGPDRTLVRESIAYCHRPGWRGALSRILFAPTALRALFLYRRFRTRRACTRPPASRGDSGDASRV
jgi:ligand-binding SRPBCC domain-containing protein